jgi:hypothetical protein
LKKYLSKNGFLVNQRRFLPLAKMLVWIRRKSGSGVSGWIRIYGRSKPATNREAIAERRRCYMKLLLPGDHDHLSDTADATGPTGCRSGSATACATRWSAAVTARAARARRAG